MIEDVQCLALTGPSMSMGDQGMSLAWSVPEAAWIRLCSYAHVACRETEQAVSSPNVSRSPNRCRAGTEGRRSAESGGQLDVAQSQQSDTEYGWKALKRRIMEDEKVLSCGSESGSRVGSGDAWVWACACEVESGKNAAALWARQLRGQGNRDAEERNTSTGRKTERPETSSTRTSTSLSLKASRQHWLTLPGDAAPYFSQVREPVHEVDCHVAGTGKWAS